MKLAKKRSAGYVGRQPRDHGISEAESLIAFGEEVFGIEPGAWAELRKGDWRKGVLAGLVRERSLVDNGWLAERLWMGVRNAVSRTIREAQVHVEGNREARNLVKKLRRLSNSLD